MEQHRTTESRLLQIHAELEALEPIFHHSKLGTSRSAYEAMTEASFWETGASGRYYSREQIIEILLERYSGPYEDEWETRDFYCQELARDLYLLTYTLAQGQRLTRRATLWRKTASGWKIVYHQGTMLEQS